MRDTEKKLETSSHVISLPRVRGARFSFPPLKTPAWEAIIVLVGRSDLEERD